MQNKKKTLPVMFYFTRSRNFSDAFTLRV